MGGSTSASASASGAKTVKVGGARQRGGGAARHQCDIGGGDGGTESGALVLIPGEKKPAQRDLNFHLRLRFVD